MMNNLDNLTRFIVTSPYHGMRIDQALTSAFPSFSRTYMQYLISEGFVKLNGAAVKKRERVSEKDSIEVIFQTLPASEVIAQDIPLKIVYEDEDMLVIDKPQGMVAHPAPGNWSDTVVNALLHHCRELSFDDEDIRPGIVHRLDKDTSGLMILAKNYETQKILMTQFASRDIHKTYLALCHRSPKVAVVDMPIGRDQKKRQQMCVTNNGKEAVTHIEILMQNHGLSLVSLRPITGRTHQIRVHLSYLGCPLLGDNMYGIASLNDKWGFTKHCLHSHRISFIHPKQKTRIELTSELPSWYNFLE